LHGGWGVSFYSFFLFPSFRCREFYSINVTGCPRDLMTHFPTLQYYSVNVTIKALK
jgi:hypothetical protein